MSKFNVGDKVQLTEESVEYYREQEWQTIDPDFAWEDPSTVIVVHEADIESDFFDEEENINQYQLRGFPFWFYEFELEYEDMRKNG